MSDFFTRLAARALNRAETVEPLIPSRYADGVGDPMFDEDSAEPADEAAVRSAPGRQVGQPRASAATPAADGADRTWRERAAADEHVAPVREQVRTGREQPLGLQRAVRVAESGRATQQSRPAIARSSAPEPADRGAVQATHAPARTVRIAAADAAESQSNGHIRPPAGASQPPAAAQRVSPVAQREPAAQPPAARRHGADDPLPAQRTAPLSRHLRQAAQAEDQQDRARREQAPFAAPAEPVIEVHIGRIEVHAAATQVPLAAADTQAPAMSLADYLNARNGGEGR